MPDAETASNVETSPSKRRPDFILVFDNATLKAEQFDIASRFLDELTTVGIDHDIEPFSANKNLGFAKLYAPDQVLYRSAEKYNMELTCHTSPEFKPPTEKPVRKFMRNELNAPEIDGVIHRRAPHLLNVNKPKAMTSAERILVLYTILNNTRFGKNEYDVGFQKLLENKIIADGFPLHDGTYHWSDTGPLNERQLLAKYWSKATCLVKEQPLDVINHYFGTSAAFYFAWLGFYNKMLLPMGICGLVFFLLGLLAFFNSEKQIANEICNSNTVICPRCHIYKDCTFNKMSDSCFSATYSYAFDNPMSFVFAILMSCWAVIFLRMWLRKERILQVRWNVKNLEVDSSTRLGFKEKTKLKMKSPITGEEEPYMPKIQQVACHLLSLFVMLLLICMRVILIIALMMWSDNMTMIILKHSKSEFLEENAVSLSSTAASLASTIFVGAFENMYCTVALWLTNLENPRTQTDFENSFVYKLYMLTFINNYTSFFYVAFFKGKFYTHPGDKANYESYLGLGTAYCDTFGCIWDFGSLMLITLIYRRTVFMRNVNYYTRRFIGFVTHGVLALFFKTIPARVTRIMGFAGIYKPPEYDWKKQWETEYVLVRNSNVELLSDYLDMAIQYGLVTFFVACFPLAPLLAWVNNIFELRLHAHKRTVERRRIIPVKVLGLRAWHRIFQAITFIGFTTNACIIAFTSDFIPKQIYKNQIGSLEGYVNFTLSVFDTSDFDGVAFDHRAEPYCFYPGLRFNTGHPSQYEPTSYIWYLLTIKVIFVVVFVHALFLLSALVSFYIPTTPFSVKQLISIQEDYMKELKLNPKLKYKSNARDQGSATKTTLL